MDFQQNQNSNGPIENGNGQNENTNGQNAETNTQQQPYPAPQAPSYVPPRPNIFATLSLVLGIASLVLMCTGILPIPLGALGLVFAVLSRRGRKFEGTALGGCITSAIGLASGLLFTVIVYAMVIFGAVNTIMENPEALTSDPQALTNQMMEAIYGEDYKQLFEQYGIDYDEMMENMYDY